MSNDDRPILIAELLLWKAMTNKKWSKQEKEIAQKAFNVAYDREQKAILEDICKRTSEFKDLAELWRLQEYLTEKRIEINEKYDYRYSVLSLVFSRLICEGWLQEEELKGLADEKLDEIRRISSLHECDWRRGPGANGD